MAKVTAFFRSIAGDRRYQTPVIARFFKSVLTSGIINGGTNLEVYNSGDNNQSIIKSGIAWIEGRYYEEDAEIALTHDVADTVNDRIDRIVLRMDAVTLRDIVPMIKKGTPAGSPEPPALTRTDDVYEISLAQVLIAADTIVIPNEAITDERLDEDVCGLVNSLIRVDTSEFQAQWDDFMETLEGQGYTPQTEFDEHKADVAHQGGRIYAYKNLGGAL